MKFFFNGFRFGHDDTISYLRYGLLSTVLVMDHVLGFMSYGRYLGCSFIPLELEIIAILVCSR
jgi:hypothetical protein